MIILHGIFSSNESMSELVSMVTSAHPGTQIYNIDGYDNVESILENMWSQVHKFKKKMLPIFENSPDGVNMICFSQGNVVLVCCVVTLSSCCVVAMYVYLCYCIVTLCYCVKLLCCHLGCYQCYCVTA